MVRWIVGTSLKYRYLVVFIALVGLIIHQGTIAYFIRDIGDSQSVSLTDYLKHLKTDFKIKLQFGVSWSFFITITS